jgi:hypothetical protein
LTAEQLEASRAERMRQNGIGALTIEDARTWLEETGLCLFLPRKQFSNFVAPSFVEAVAGERNPAPAAKLVAQAEELLVRLEADNVAVRLNLLGQPGEQPDFVVASWVLPYVYALRGDRDWRRSPQLTGSRQVSQLAIQAYKQLETGEASIPQLRHALGREVSESAVLRAIVELWQQLRIIPIVSSPGRTAHWQLLKVRYQKAIAEGASTSQVTAISVLASIYLQAVITATMEEVELFLAPLTARSKVREVLRGLVATRQVHTISMGHAPHFYVAGTLPEFAPQPTIYASSSMPASAHFLRSYDREEEYHEPYRPAVTTPAAAETRKPEPAPAAAAKPPSNGKPHHAQPRHSRPPAHAHSRKPVQGSAKGRVASHGKTNVDRSGKISLGSNHNHRDGDGRNGRPMAKIKPSASRSLRNGHAKATAKPAARKDARSSRKPAMAAAKSGRARFSYAGSAKSGAKKRG